MSNFDASAVHVYSFELSVRIRTGNFCPADLRLCSLSSHSIRVSPVDMCLSNMRKVSVPKLKANAANQPEDNGAPPTFSKIQHVAGFPNLIEPREHTASDIYCRTLSMSGNGFPSWIGYILRLLPPYSKRTVEVGDVGYINQNGNFVFVFNLFLPSNDPLNQLFPKELPEGYFPLDPPTDNEILRIPDYFSPGSVIVSNGVDVSRLSESPLHLKFTSTEPEAVALIMPDGASREDFKGISRLQEYLKSHAESWIQYFNDEKVPYSIPNGGIYVITGCDKAPSFSTAIFPRRNFLGSRRTSFQFSNGYMQPGTLSGVHPYERRRNRPEQEYCLFIRGIRLAFSDCEWNMQIDDIAARDTLVSPLPSKPPISDHVTPPKTDDEELLHPETDVNNEGLSRSTNRDNSDRSTNRDDSDRSTNKDDSDRSTDNGDNERSINSNSDDSDSSSDEIQEVRVHNYPFHPSDLILQIMLSRRPDAKLALVDDYTWSRLAKVDQNIGLHELSRAPLISRCMQSSFISDWGSMMEAIFKSHNIVETDGILNLIPKQSKNSTSIPWFRNLQKRLRSRYSAVEPTWAMDLINDLVRQGENIKGQGQKFHIQYR